MSSQLCPKTVVYQHVYFFLCFVNPEEKRQRTGYQVLMGITAINNTELYIMP